MGFLLQSTVIMVDLWIGQEHSGVSGRCNIFNIFYLVQMRFIFYFWVTWVKWQINSTTRKYCSVAFVWMVKPMDFMNVYSNVRATLNKTRDRKVLLKNVLTSDSLGVSWQCRDLVTERRKDEKRSSKKSKSLSPVHLKTRQGHHSVPCFEFQFEFILWPRCW